jgi:MoaA/NifB/PqqE/SkfB family radical SAM enzyme
MIEMTNACDLACRHCPFHGEGVEKLRPIGHMPERMWRAAVDEVAGWNSEVTLQPWGMGEPLLHPQLWDLVSEAKRHQQLRVGFYSNGNQWQEADVDAAVESRLDWICLSIDGRRRDVFEHYRVGADMDRVLGTLARLARARAAAGTERPQIRVNMVAYPELRDHGDEFVESLRELADSVMVSRFRQVGSRRFLDLDLPRTPCYQLDTMLAVASDGRVVQCCEDQQGQAPVGQFPAQSLSEIWTGPALTRLREAHRAGRFDDCPLCGDCDAWAGALELTVDGRDTRIRHRAAGSVYEFREARTLRP